MSFRLAIVSKVELWNFRNSSISVRLCWWTSRNSNCCRHNCPRRIRRSSSAWAAWSSWWPIFSQYSAIIIRLCSSSKVLICAFEPFRSQVSLIHRPLSQLGCFQKTCCEHCTCFSWHQNQLIGRPKFCCNNCPWRSCSSGAMKFVLITSCLALCKNLLFLIIEQSPDLCFCASVLTGTRRSISNGSPRSIEH